MDTKENVKKRKNDQNEENPIQSATKDLITSRSVTLGNHEAISQALARMIGLDMLPISFAEGSGFKQFMLEIMPQYKLPASISIKTTITQLYEECKNKVANFMSEIDYCALTTDNWTLNNMTSYITVTVHAIDKNWQPVSYVLDTEEIDERHASRSLNFKLSKITENWNLNDKIVACVHDNSPNIVAAVKQLQIPDNVSCVAYNLQLCINKALDYKELKPLISKCMAVADYFKHSNVATNALEVKQDQFDLPKHKLMQCVKTRWTTIQPMIERLFEQRHAVTAVLADRTITSISLELSAIDFIHMEQLNLVLLPLERITALLSPENKPTLSIMQPVLESAISLLKNIHLESNLIKGFRNILVEDLEIRFHNLLPPAHSMDVKTKAEIYDIATFLDPRYKNKEREMGMKLKVTRTIKDTVEVKPISKSVKSEPNTSILETLFPEDFTESSPGDDIDLYFVEAEIPKTACPLLWWKANMSRFKTVETFARKYLCIPATSTASERTLTTAANVIAAKRNCLDPSDVNMLIFLHHNL